MGVTAEMSRHPVQNHADVIFMTFVDELHEFFGFTVSGSDTVVSGDLITPGIIQGMFHHREKLHVGVAQILHIRNELLYILLKIKEFSIPVSLPGAQMNLINVHGIGVQILSLVFGTPGTILPFESCEVFHHRSCFWPQFRIKCIGVCLEKLESVMSSDSVFVDCIFSDPFHKGGPDSSRTLRKHFSITPVVEITSYENTLCIGCPYGELHTFFSFKFDDVCAHEFITANMFSGVEQIMVELCVQYFFRVVFCLRHSFLLLIFCI